MLRRIVGYAVSRSAVESLLGLRGVALASLLGPELFGLWALFRLALHYFAFFSHSLNCGMEVKVAAAASPQSESISRGQKIWGQIVLGPTLAYGLLTAGIALVGFWRVEGLTSLVVLAITATLIAERLWRYALTFTRAAGMFQRFAVLEFLYSVLQLILTLSFAVAWGLGGALMGFLAATVTSLCAAARRVPWRPRWSLSRAKHVFGIGFPVSLASISTTFLQTIDQLLVGAFVGIAALGTYAFAISLSGVGVHLALIARNVILTDVYEGMSRGGSGQAGRLLMGRSLTAFTTLLPPLAGFAALSLSPAIQVLLPQYQAAVVVAQVFIFIGVLQGIVNISVMGIVAEGRQVRVPLICLGAICLNFCFSLLALSLGLGLQGVAVGAFLSRMTYAAAIGSVLTVGNAKSSRYSSLTRSLTPTLWCAVAVVAIQLSIPILGWKSLALAFLLYSISLIPLAILFRSTLASYKSSRSSE